MAPELFTVPETGKLTGRDPQTIRRWCEEIPELGIKLGGRLYIRRHALTRLLEGSSATPGPEGLPGDPLRAAETDAVIGKQ